MAQAISAQGLCSNASSAFSLLILRLAYIRLKEMGDADIKETTVTKDGKLLIPDGSLSKEDGKGAIAGTWQISGVGPIDVTVSGDKVESKQAPFGNMKFMGEIEEKEKLFGMHVNIGGFPMKAWMKKEDGKPVLVFTNGARWSKL